MCRGKRYTNVKYASYNVTEVGKSMKMRQDFEAGVRNLRKFKSALILLFIYLLHIFLERKFCFISDASNWGWGGWWTSVQKLTPLPCPPTTSGARHFINRSGRGGAATCRNRTVISNNFKLIISGLTSIILVVLGTVNLQVSESDTTERLNWTDWIFSSRVHLFPFRCGQFSEL